MNTVASSKSPSGTHSRVEPPVKNSSHLSAVKLPVISIRLGPSFSHLASTTWNSRSVHSLSNLHLPISSMIRQAGRIGWFIALAAVPGLTALASSSDSSRAFT